MPPTPDPTIIERVVAGHTEVYSRVDIYEADSTTLWMSDAPTIDGSVSVDMSRDERRTADVTFDNSDLQLRSRPGAFWYDKVVKIYRGIRGRVDYILDGEGEIIYDDDNEPVIDPYGSFPDWETQIGEFFVDDIDAESTPSQISVTLRDATRKLLQAKFTVTTLFASGVSIESVVQAIAFAGGIPLAKIDLPLTGVNLLRDHTYDRETERWEAIKELGEIYGYEIYFDYTGTLVMNEFADPADAGVSPSVWTFEVGGRDVRNGGFEEIDPTTGDPDWWTYTGDAFRDTLNQINGDACLRLGSTGGSGATALSSSIFVEPGWMFDVSAWSRATDTGTAKSIQVLFGSTEGFTVPTATVDIVNGAAFALEYDQDSGEVTVPTGASWMRIKLTNAAGANRYAWFDDVYVQRIHPLADTKGNIVNYNKSTSSSRIYNHISVSGESSDSIPVHADAENTEPTSPTRISELGRRTKFYTSPFITEETQAQDTADRFLKVLALESFNASIESLVTPWLEAGQIVTFRDPESAPTDPVRYLLSDLNIPLSPAPMSATVKRVTLVG